MHSHEKIGDVFDSWARSDRAQRMADGHQYGAQYGFSLLDVQPAHRYLDIGCGLGYSVRWAAKRASSVDALGVDVSTDMVERAGELSKAWSNARFKKGHFPDVVEDERFDRIFSVEALYYLPNLEIALQQVFDHLTDGGRFVTVIDYYRENDGCHEWSDRVGVPLILWSIEQWCTGLRDAGFKHVTAVQRRHPVTDEAPNWQQIHGSLVLSAQRPA